MLGKLRQGDSEFSVSLELRKFHSESASYRGCDMCIGAMEEAEGEMIFFQLWSFCDQTLHVFHSMLIFKNLTF